MGGIRVTDAQVTAFMTTLGLTETRNELMGLRSIVHDAEMQQEKLAAELASVQESSAPEAERRRSIVGQDSRPGSQEPVRDEVITPTQERRQSMQNARDAMLRSEKAMLEQRALQAEQEAEAQRAKAAARIQALRRGQQDRTRTQAE